MNRVTAAIGTLVFFVLAPGTVAGLVPYLVTRWDRTHTGVDALDVLAVVLGALGLVVVVSCFARFVSEGVGTPAPVAPTESLVVGGIYRYVRNPMYLGVASVIAAQAIAFRSPGLWVWLGVFCASVWSFVTFYEEPTLREQHGESYDRYRDNVPGWWPRFTPWRG